MNTERQDSDGVALMSNKLNFGQARLLEAQLALRFVLGTFEKQQIFTGQRLLAGQIAPEFGEIDDGAAKYYRNALKSFLAGLGVDVQVVPAKTTDAQTVEMSGMPVRAPFETIVISGSVPGNALDGGRKATAQIAEACVELVRVLLGTAVVAAAEDRAADERVVVLFRTEPEIAGKIDFLNGKMVGLCRIKALVYCEREPRASYLLGSAAGQPKALQLAYDFPLVEQIYGPNRLRWRDLRSPDYELVPAEGVAS